jgi:hypothetical protein
MPGTERVIAFSQLAVKGLKEHIVMKIIFPPEIKLLSTNKLSAIGQK